MFRLTGRLGWRGGGASVPKRFAAIDFDSRRIHIVCAERTGKGARIRQLTHADIPAELDTSDARAVGAFLGRTLRKMRLGVKAVVMSVPRGLAVLKPLQFPPGTALNDLAGMVQYQVEKELPFPLAEAVVDFTVANHYDAEVAADRPNVNVLVSAVRLPVVEHYKQIALAAGVKLFRLGLRSAAAMRCVTECLGPEAAGPLAMIHVTSDETEIMVLSAGTLAFSRSALFAEPLEHEVPPGEVARHVRTVATEIARSLQAYQAAEGGGNIKQLLLAGGTGIEAGVAKSLARLLGVRCERFNPAEALSLRDDGQTSAFIASLGMAVGHDGSATPFDFLNPKRPRVRHDVKKIRRGLLAAAAGVALVVAVTAGLVWVGGKNAAVEALKKQNAELEKKRKPVDLRTKQLKALSEWNAKNSDTLGHWAYVSTVAPSCTDMYITSFHAGSDGALKLSVRAKDHNTILKLSRALQAGNSGYTVSTGRGTWEKDNVSYRHGTTVTVRPPKGKPGDISELKPPSRPLDDVSHREKYR